MRKLLGLGRALAVAGLLGCGLCVPAGAQTTATWSFENISAGKNTPEELGTLGTSITVWSDDGLVSATFETISDSTQFGIHDNVAVPVADSPMSGNILYGGRSSYPDISGAYGTAAIKITFSEAISLVSFDFLDASQNVTGASDPEWLYLSTAGVDTSLVPTCNAAWFTDNLNSLGYDYQWAPAPGIGLAGVTTLYLWVTPGSAPSGNSSASSTDNLYAEFGLDNLTVKYAGTAVPEPGALALLVGLALPAGWLLKRRAA